MQFLIVLLAATTSLTTATPLAARFVALQYEIDYYCVGTSTVGDCETFAKGNPACQGKDKQACVAAIADWHKQHPVSLVARNNIQYQIESNSHVGRRATAEETKTGLVARITPGETPTNNIKFDCKHAADVAACEAYAKGIPTCDINTLTDEASCNKLIAAWIKQHPAVVARDDVVKKKGAEKEKKEAEREEKSDQSRRSLVRRDETPQLHVVGGVLMGSNCLFNNKCD